MHDLSTLAATVSNMFRRVAVNCADGQIVGCGAGNGWRRESIAQWVVFPQSYGLEERGGKCDIFHRIEWRALRLYTCQLPYEKLCHLLRSGIPWDDCGSDIAEKIGLDCGRELKNWCREHSGVIMDVTGPMLEEGKGDFDCMKFAARMKSHLNLCVVAALVNSIWLQAGMSCAKVAQQVWREAKPRVRNLGELTHLVQGLK